jgi:hypothetical protein
MASPYMSAVHSFFSCFLGRCDSLNSNLFGHRLSGFLEVVVKVVVKTLLLEFGVTTLHPVAFEFLVKFFLAFRGISLGLFLLRTVFTSLLASAELVTSSSLGSDEGLLASLISSLTNSS